MTSNHRAQPPPAAPGLAGVWRHVAAWLRPYPRQSLTVLALILVQVGYALVVPFAYQTIFDRVLPGKDLSTLGWVMTGLLAAFLLYATATVLQERVAARVGTQVMNDLRLLMFERVQQLGLSFHARRDAGDVVSRFATDLTVVETSIVRPLPVCLLNVLILLSSALALLWVEWRLALLTYAALPLGFVAPRLLGARATFTTYERQTQDARVVSVVQESVAAHLVVRAFGMQRARLESFARRLEALARASDAASFWSGLVGRGASLGVSLVQLIVVIVGAWLVIRGHLSAGALVSFVGLLLNVGTSVTPLTRLVPPLIHAAGSLHRIQELLAEPPAVTERPDAVSLPPLSREIRFEGVGLGDGPQAVLRGVSFAIRAGDSVALVGASGSGKSTVLSLLMRLQDPSEGRVTFDGLDLRQATDLSLRAQLGVVLQDTMLFNTTVRENIRCARPEASDREVEAAARLAQVHDAILGLPEGYETPVGERGGNLSGGQRQRVAIARALLRDPRVVILDEATSALDAGTAAAIHDTLRELEEGRTVVTVTHRLASVAHVDRIFLLDGGRLVEQGTHEELLGREGLYRNLWEKQGGFKVAGDGAQARVDAARLRGIPLLAGLPESLLAELAEQFGTERSSEGRLVFAQGDPGDKLFIIVQGVVEVLHASGSAAPVLLQVLEDGDYFGELALLDEGPRSATVRTRTPCLFLTLLRHHFRKLLGELPQVRAEVERVAAARRAATRA